LEHKLEDKTAARKKIALVNSRMHSDEMPRVSDFDLPYNGGEYIGGEKKIGKIQAKEHRNAMQVLPHILHDIDDDLCHLACR